MRAKNKFLEDYAQKFLNQTSDDEFDKIAFISADELVDIEVEESLEENRDK